MHEAEGNGSAVPRRRLGRNLRELRERASLSQDDAAIALDCSRQKIWRIESGAVPVRPGDVKVLCNLYGAGPVITRALVALALHTRDKGWWQEYADSLPNWFTRYIGLEAAASQLRFYQGEIIPALLQTRRYTETIYRDQPGFGAHQRERLVEVQLRRQRIITRCVPPAPRLDVILSETVLHRHIGVACDMWDQLRHLHQLSQRENVSVRIIPLTAEPTLAGAAGAFVLIDFPGGEDAGASTGTTIYSESLTQANHLDRPDEIRAYEDAWARLTASALDRERSAELIMKVLRAQG